MTHSHGICILCRWQLFGPSAAASAARQGLNISSGGNGTRFRGRWGATTAWTVRPASSSTVHGDRSIRSDANEAGGAAAAELTRAPINSGARRPTRTTTTTTTTTTAPLPRRSRPRQIDDAALSVFRDVVQKQRKQAHGPTTQERDPFDELEQTILGRGNSNEQERQVQQPPAGRPLRASMDLYNQLVKLTQLRAQPEGASAAARFAFFETALYPQMTHAPRELPNIFRQAAQQLVRDVSVAKQRNYGAADLPSVARITQVRRQLDLLNMPEPWVPLVLGLVEAVVRANGKEAQNRNDEVQPQHRKSVIIGEEQRETETQTSAEAGDEAIEKQGATDENAEGAQSANVDATANNTILLDDLVQTWRIFSLPDIVVANPDALDRSHISEFRLPRPDPVLLDKYAHQRNLPLALTSLFPRYAPRQMKPLAPAVLATYALLTDTAVCPPATADTAREFVQAVASVLKAVPVSRATVAGLFQTHPTLGTYVLGRWSQLTQKKPVSPPREGSRPPPLLESRINRKSGGSGGGGTGGGVSSSAALDDIHQQLIQALRARNLGACEAAWDRFWAAVTMPDADGAKRLRRSAEIFDYFIMAFTTMRMPQRAIAVWNAMALAGVPPTLRTWTSFMEGCKRASNPTGIHNIWAKLMASGVPVDTAVWTARISGLIQTGDAEAGMRALEEMQQAWEADRAKDALAENKRNRPAAVRPTIEPVNAAIAGVLRRGDLDAAKTILAWAGRNGIAPDRITFNTILRPLVRSGRSDEVDGLLEMMRQRGIPPDEATVTILLDGALGEGALGGRSAAERAAVVRQLLAEVEAAGLSANEQMYAKMVYLLLHEEEDAGTASKKDPDAANAADAAVNVVLARMRQRGLPLSAHICTILAEHYFARTPPDLDAVQRLIETGWPAPAPAETTPTAETSSGHDGPTVAPPTFDRVFWERVVRGYAQVGDTAHALQYFAHIADSLSVTTSTLEDLLRALLRNGEMAAAQQLVTKVQAQKTLLVHGKTGPGGRGSGVSARGGSGSGSGGGGEARLFRHRFWHLAAEHGLL
ncbi:pentatricopeptide repeat protein [Niveomyces insectorum RCEF 264]|uniref:Pentatricopeptide repeat protein n=1 Tax=Niveomyces insectorum RCEF 264 TaxID=1081102 RepID=A0A167Y2N0_9HYPO|nr:pentatricopeptide repeat protein [Niveomyces insectorum RCEF 264]